MNSTADRQTMALAGVFQAAALVDALARTGEIDNAKLASMMATVLNLQPTSFADIFADAKQLAPGLQALRQNLGAGGSREVNKQLLHYAVALIAVEGKLAKRRDLLDQLAAELKRAVEQQRYFDDFCHASVVAAIARCYQNSVSKLDFRIRVVGNPTYLQQATIAEKVRSVLLYGVRCALLWRQQGGRRWHLMLQRNKLRDRAAQILEQL